jgi:septal ring factor EnvC (AmiA/AmiB activator)
VEEVENVNVSLARTQDELLIKRATLRRRVQEIYKRGPLYAFEALLSAESFGALVARYKYLHLVAQRDRALVKRVEALSGQISAQRFLLVRLRSDMETNRKQKAEEEARLRRLELQRGRTLAQIQQQAKQAEDRFEAGAARRAAAGGGDRGPRGIASARRVASERRAGPRAR